MENFDFFERVREGYEKLMVENRERFVRIDGKQSEEKVQTDIRKSLQGFVS